MKSITVVSAASLALFSVACGDDTNATSPDAALPDVDAAVDAAPPAPGFTMLDYAIATDITPDGRVALFEKLTGDAIVVLYDTVTHVGTEKTSVGDPSVNLATGISQNLVVTAEYGNPVTGANWTEATGWTAYPESYATGCEPMMSGSFDISADAKVTTGLVWHGCNAEAFRWTDTGGAGTVTILQKLGTPSSSQPASNRGTVVSKDGAVIGGFAANGTADRVPAKWTADGNGVLLDPTNVENPGEVLSINGDGTVLAGILLSDGFVWTAATGMVMLPNLPDEEPNTPTFPNAMTADGKLIFGGVGDAFGIAIPTAVVWTSTTIRTLASIAAAAGVTIPAGTQLQNITAVSADGLVLVGTAATDTTFGTFVLRLPANAYN